MAVRLTDLQERLLERIVRAGRLRLPLADWRRRAKCEGLQQRGLVRWDDGWVATDAGRNWLDRNRGVVRVETPQLSFDAWVKRN